MIIVSIYGGLGNQLFQYACGKAVASRLGVELKLDTSLVCDRTESENFTFRDYELGCLNIDEKIASSEEVRQYVPNLWNASNFSIKLFKIKRLITNKKLYCEKKRFQFEARVSLIKDNTLLYGYFQTEKYFLSIRNELLKLFIFKEQFELENESLLNKINTENAVSIHVRRGDYLNSDFELLSLNYYFEAIEIIKKRVKNPVFYIFSDDLLWVEKEFSQFDFQKTIIKNNINKKPFIDMYLMSQCKYNICANSTFSWWAAWLNNNTDKIIIAPKKWFKEGEFKNSTFDLIPSTWLQI